MDSAPEFLNLFVEPTGELIYFLAVFLISQATMLMALGQRLRGPSEVTAGRYATLLTGIVAAWVAMGIGGLVVLISDEPEAAILPPLERAVSALVILLASAGLLAADNENNHEYRQVRRVVLAGAAAIAAAYLLTAVSWFGQADGKDFNAHFLGFAWTFVPGLLLIVAIALLLTRFKTTADIPLKLIFLVVLEIGYSYTLVRISSKALDGHTSGALRLAFLTAMPVLIITIYRLVIARLNTAIDEISAYAEAVSRPQAAIQPPMPSPVPAPLPKTPRLSRPSPALSTPNESMALLRAVGLMLDKEDPETIPRQIVTAIATVLKADIAVLISHEDAEWADVLAAYDHIQQRLVPGLALNLEEQPTLLEAIERKAQCQLSPDSNLDELVDLYTRLDIQQLGPAYIQPLLRSREVVGVAIVGLPYTSRELNNHEQTLLEGLAPIAARLLTLSRNSARLRTEANEHALQAVIMAEDSDGLDQQSLIAARQEMQASLELAQEQIGELSRMVRELQIELDYERNRLTQLVADGDEAMSITQRIEVLSHERQELATERERLAQALQEAQTTLLSATAQSDQDVYTTMIESLRRERDELQVQKSKLERQITELRDAQDTAAVPQTLRDMLTELSEDKAHLTAERDTIQRQLEQVNDELRTLGIEDGPLALAKTLGQLTEERTYFKTRAEKIAQERDLLLNERRELEDRIQREAEREAQIVALEADLKRLATDREALINQRDSIRAERDDLLRKREIWFDQRTRLVAEATVVKNDLDDVMFEFNQAKGDLRRLSEERVHYDAERDRLVAEITALKTERDQLLARADGNRELLEQLGADGVGALKTMIDELTAERQQLEEQLIQAQQDFALLEHQYAHPPASSTEHTQPIVPENAEVIMSIAQELRTPMTSLQGYTDLLLNEAVGILGATQRKFLQRIQANNDRLANLVDDLVNITMLDSDDLKIEPVTVNMTDIIEDAITSAGNQFREKEITLHMSLDEQLPPLRADRDAMHQVVIQLLSNAYLASPQAGEVVITAQHAHNIVPPVQDDASPPREPIEGILVSITDQGSGIPPDEQRRVFGRFYRADNPLIDGLGDTGVGLSIAKALVEAHRGTIWLESQLGTGSTFHFIIPFSRQQSFAQET